MCPFISTTTLSDSPPLIGNVCGRHRFRRRPLLPLGAGALCIPLSLDFRFIRSLRLRPPQLRLLCRNEQFSVIFVSRDLGGSNANVTTITDSTTVMTLFVAPGLGNVAIVPVKVVCAVNIMSV